jgi:branched-chain amino acid transport system permease protein
MALSAIITGLGLGSMYGLLALGYHLTYAVSRTVNFAQGATMMLGAVLCFTFWVTAGLPLAVSVALALMLCGGWGWLVERVAVRPFVNKGSGAWLMATVALGIVLENAVLFTFGKDPRGMPAGLLTASLLEAGGLRIQPLQLIIPATGLALAGSIQLFFRTTRLGKISLAVMQNADAAKLMGIKVQRIISGSFMISGILAGIAGILISPLFSISSTMGTLFGIKGFAVAILGGIGNATGVVLAGLLYGLMEAGLISTFGSASSQILGFGLVILVLWISPDGLFGRASARKV